MISTTDNLGQIYLSTGGGGGGITTNNLTSTTDGLGQIYLSTGGGGGVLTLDLVSTTVQLQSNIENWSGYPATSNLVFNTNVGIQMSNPALPLNLRVASVNIVDSNGGYGDLYMGRTLGFVTSTTSEVYFIGAGESATGTISSFIIGRDDGVSINPASLYLSSLYFGDIGGITAGQLTTDGNVTDLYWNSNKLLTNAGNVTFSSLYVSSILVNMSAQDAPPWNPLSYILGNDPNPEPLSVDVFGSARILKNIYVGSTTTILGTNGITTANISSMNTQVSTLNFIDNLNSTYSLKVHDGSLVLAGSNTSANLPSMPGYASSIQYNNENLRFDMFTQILTQTNFVWKDSYGKSPASSYRIHVSWSGTPNFADSVTWYFTLINQTTSETYTGSVFDTNAPAVAILIQNSYDFTTILSASYMDIFRDVGIRNDDNIYANLYLKTTNSGGTFSNNFRCAFTIEPIGYIYAA
jgi:hypothetical protein